MIHFNFGIHDRNTPPADYTERLEQLVQLREDRREARLGQHHADPRRPAKKQTAASIVERNGLPPTYAAPRRRDRRPVHRRHAAPGELQNPNDVHFNAKGYDFLGETVAIAVEAQLSK